MSDALDSKRCSEYLQALADPHRLRIVESLQNGPLTVTAICKQVRSSPGTVSHHLKKLRLAGLVTGQKQGRQVIYALNSALLNQSKGTSLKVLDFGCCRLEFGKQ